VVLRHQKWEKGEMMRAFLIAAPMLMAFCALASSRVEAAPQKNNSSAQSHPETKVDQRGTDKAPLSIEPLSVKLLNTGDSEAEAAQKSEGITEQERTNWWTIRLTLALMAATVLQFGAVFWQGILFRRQTGLVKKQIELAREEFISTHRPKMIMRDASRLWESGESIFIYSLVNIGGTSAEIVESWIFEEVVHENTPIRNARPLGHSDLGSIRFAAGQSRDFRFTNKMRCPGADDKLALYFAGSIRFKDDLGNLRSTIFRRKFDGIRFFESGNLDHEYSD